MPIDVHCSNPAGVTFTFRPPLGGGECILQDEVAGFHAALHRVQTKSTDEIKAALLDSGGPVDARRSWTAFVLPQASPGNGLIADHKAFEVFKECLRFIDDPINLGYARIVYLPERGQLDAHWADLAALCDIFYESPRRSLQPPEGRCQVNLGARFRPSELQQRHPVVKAALEGVRAGREAALDKVCTGKQVPAGFLCDGGLFARGPGQLTEAISPRFLVPGTSRLVIRLEASATGARGIYL